MQDASAWLTLAVALCLAPWDGLWDRLELERPEPAGAFVVAGVALAAIAAAHGAGRLAGGGPRAVVFALVANLVVAGVLVAWLLGDPPSTGTLGTVILAVTAAGLALQAAVDGVMLHAGGP